MSDQAVRPTRGRKGRHKDHHGLDRPNLRRIQPIGETSGRAVIGQCPGPRRCRSRPVVVFRALVELGDSGRLQGLLEHTAT